VGYSGLLGPVAGIMVTDYFLVRHTRLDSYSLYRRGGIYEYTNGINPRAIVALVLGIGAALVGRFVSEVAFLYDYAWFVGFFLSGGLYYLMMLGHRVPRVQEVEG
jgi:NCS1 family nucleobase:cation symporter-1